MRRKSRQISGLPSGAAVAEQLLTPIISKFRCDSTEESLVDCGHVDLIFIRIHDVLVPKPFFEVLGMLEMVVVAVVVFWLQRRPGSFK